MNSMKCIEKHSFQGNLLIPTLEIIIHIRYDTINLDFFVIVYIPTTYFKKPFLDTKNNDIHNVQHIHIT